MAAGQGTRQVVLLGTGLGLALLLLGVTEARLGLGGATALVSLIPVALAFALGGPVAGGLAALLGVVGAAALIGGPAAAVLALRHAFPGLILGLTLSRRFPLSVTLMLVAGASLVGLTALVWTYLPAGTAILPLLGRRVDAHVAELERVPSWLGLAGDPAWVAESARLLSDTMRIAGPGLILVGLLVVALTNYLGARLCLRGRGFRPFAEEAVPDHLVWAVIGGGFLLVSQHDPFVPAGLNILIVLAPLYAIQGLAILRHFFQKARISRPLQGVSFGLFAVQPLLLIAAACLGLSDLWVDFRRIRRAATPA
ncbi:MAG TPA: DUF2232 domain-containing protein [Methylomirabilota bacterium]|jgi:uncharacterized protein YybS (DUF2232 family)|nr:DUF2232 domain-containing protein [Methylomirabilota bacterium]